MNVSQNAKFSTKFPTLNNDFSEMRKFQPKPLKPRCDIGLKTPNPDPSESDRSGKMDSTAPDL